MTLKMQKKIVVLIGYGDEQNVYKFCRKVWDLYLATKGTESLDYYFVQEKNEQSDEVLVHDRDMYIKVNSSLHSTKLMQNSSLEPILPSDWSEALNIRQTIRAKKSVQWVLSNYGNVCSHVFFTSITSIHEMDTLTSLVNLMPHTGVYAGAMCHYSKTSFTDGPLVFASGSNTILSNDLMGEVVDNCKFDNLPIPFDAIVGVILRKAKKISIPRFDIEKSVDLLMLNFDLDKEISSAFEVGHFHFRVKSKGNRGLTDHLVMLEIYKKIMLGMKPNIGKLISLCRQID